MAVQGLDSNGDGAFSAEELRPLAEVNVNSLKDFDYFTFVHIDDGDNLPLKPPENYSLDYSRPARRIADSTSSGTGEPSKAGVARRLQLLQSVVAGRSLRHWELSSSTHKLAYGQVKTSSLRLGRDHASTSPRTQLAEPIDGARGGSLSKFVKGHRAGCGSRR
jgi:hypothetical protein